MKILSFIFGRKEKSNFNEKNFIENFENDSNEWIDKNSKSEYLIQEIKDGCLFLKSLTKEMGVCASIFLPINEQRNYEIETRFKISGIEDLYYSSIEFGIKRKNRERTLVEGKYIPTTFGSKHYYFGYSNTKEYLITKWKYGTEKYYKRGFEEEINARDFNTLKILKEKSKMNFYINGKLIHRQKYLKLFGTGIGFATAPNSELLVDYIKITYK